MTFLLLSHTKGSPSPGAFKAIMIASGGLSGGFSSTIAGGKFVDGFRQGIITSGLNHLVHSMVQLKGSDYIVYDGDEIIWYDSKGNIIDKFAGTSGLPGYQNSSSQSIPNAGPIPEGNYKVNLSLSSNRMVEIDPNTGIIFAGDGIQRIPKTFTTTSGSVEGYSAWGNIRARLSPDSGTKTFGRSNFYLHNSHKGYSHGCIETTTRFFSKLINYSKNHTYIRVIVNYPTNNSSTLGNTRY